MQQYNYNEVSKLVGFYRRHQNIPTLAEVDATVKRANEGEIKSCIELLNWRRHCFYAKSEHEMYVMSKVMDFCNVFLTKE